jgi:hypothetical protein
MKNLIIKVLSAGLANWLTTYLICLLGAHISFANFLLESSNSKIAFYMGIIGASLVVIDVTVDKTMEYLNSKK